MALVVGTIGSVAFLGLLIPLGSAERPAFTHGDLVLLPMVSALVVGIVVAVLVWRWAAMAGWSDRHLLALAGGSLIGHTLIFALTPHTLAERLSLLGLDGMVVLLLAALDRAVAKRPGTDEARAGQAIRATGGADPDREWHGGGPGGLRFPTAARRRGGPGGVLDA